MFARRDDEKKIIPEDVPSSILMGFEARKALQIFVQNNDCSGRC